MSCNKFPDNPTFVSADILDQLAKKLIILKKSKWRWTPNRQGYRSTIEGW